jgi:uncharacterized protein (TIGR00255 family)
MVQSMTGFGSGEKDGCRVEARSVNHKFLETYVRLPAFLSHLEMPIRAAVKERFSRGKFDITVTVSEQAEAQIHIDLEFVEKLLAEFRRLQQDLGVAGDIDINTLMGMQGMFVETTRSFDAGAVMDILDRALDDLREMRATEGAALASAITAMVDGLGRFNEQVKTMSGRALIASREKFSERMKLLLNGKEPDEDRLLQEAAVMAARLDISEETARIESHVRQFAEILSTGGIIGRKLDFILQELNREVNTVASKSADYELASTTVEMKTEIEKIREQVQNIQ